MYNQRIMFWFCFCFCFTTNKGKRTGNVSARFQIPEASWRQLDPSKPAQGKLGSQKEGLFGSWKPCWSCYLRHQRQDNQISPLFPPSNFLAPPLFSWSWLCRAEPEKSKESVWEQTGKWPAPLLFIIRFHFIFQCLGPWGGISPHNPIVLLTLPHQKKNAFLKHRENHLAGLHKFIFYGKALRHQNQRWRKEYGSQNKLYCSLEMFCT